MKRRLIGVAAVALGTLLMGGVVVQTASAADPVPTTVTLPLFGSPLTITITTGPGGALTDVSVNPATNTVADSLSPRKVVFESANPTDPLGDPAKVVIKSKKGGQSVSARAGSLTDISGPGSWSGDLFGTGTATSVNFIIGTINGGPDITGVTSSDATAAIGAVEYSSDDDDDESEQSAKVSIKFTDPASDQSRTLTIKVKVEEEDGETEAKLSISLSRLKGVAVPAAEAVGAHTWTGLLCDGTTTATITYVVALDGSISGVVVSPDTADVRIDDNKIDARFSDDERVRIRVREDDGMIKISVEERLRCDAEDPTTNVSTTVDDDDDDDDDENENRGRDDDDDDDASSTSEVTTTDDD